MEHQRCQIGSTATDVLDNLFWSCCYYDASKTVSVRLKWYGVVWRLAFFCIIFIGYFGVYNLWYTEGYKEKADDAEIISYAKIRGFLKTNLSSDQFDDKTKFEKYNNKIWEAKDDFFEKTSHSFFIPTNLFITSNQTKTKCADYPSALNKCKQNENQTCQDEKQDVWTCESEGWCPPKERDRPKVAILSGTKDFAIQLQQLISFPKFGIELSNSNSDNKTTCSFESTDDEKKHCRNFLVSEMVRAIVEKIQAEHLMI
jgi:hypothetical protein